MGDCIAVVGGMNVDIGGRPARRLVLKDSNPGRVSIRPGGVGRNIAHDLRLLGMEVRMLSAVGDDEHGELLLRSCAACGIDTSLCLRAEGESSSTYLYITDEHGDMQLAVADMDVTARITPAVIAAPSRFAHPMPVDAGRNVLKTSRDSKNADLAALNSPYQSHTSSM